MLCALKSLRKKKEKKNNEATEEEEEKQGADQGHQQNSDITMTKARHIAGTLTHALKGGKENQMQQRKRTLKQNACCLKVLESHQQRGQRRDHSSEGSHTEKHPESTENFTGLGI